MSRGWSLLVFLLLGGCYQSFTPDVRRDAGPTRDVGVRDAGRIDAGRRDAGARVDAGRDAGVVVTMDGGFDAGSGASLTPGYRCEPDFVIERIIDRGAPPGEYTVLAAGEHGPSATLRRNGVDVSTVSYDWLTTIGSVGSGREHRFAFTGYFDIDVANAFPAGGVGTRNLYGLHECLFDGRKVIRGATSGP